MMKTKKKFLASKLFSGLKYDKHYIRKVITELIFFIRSVFDEIRLINMKKSVEKADNMKEVSTKISKLKGNDSKNRNLEEKYGIFSDSDNFREKKQIGKIWN